MSPLLLHRPAEEDVNGVVTGMVIGRPVVERPTIGIARGILQGHTLLREEPSDGHGNRLAVRGGVLEGGEERLEDTVSAAMASVFGRLRALERG